MQIDIIAGLEKAAERPDLREKTKQDLRDTIKREKEVLRELRSAVRILREGNYEEEVLARR